MSIWGEKVFGPRTREEEARSVWGEFKHAVADGVVGRHLTDGDGGKIASYDHYAAQLAEDEVLMLWAGSTDTVAAAIVQSEEELRATTQSYGGYAVGGNRAVRQEVIDEARNLQGPWQNFDTAYEFVTSTVREMRAQS